MIGGKNFLHDIEQQNNLIAPLQRKNCIVDQMGLEPMQFLSLKHLN